MKALFKTFLIGMTILLLASCSRVNSYFDRNRTIYQESPQGKSLDIPPGLNDGKINSYYAVDPQPVKGNSLSKEVLPPRVASPEDNAQQQVI